MRGSYHDYIATIKYNAKYIKIFYQIATIKTENQPASINIDI